MADEKKLSVLLEHKPQLDGNWNFQAQFNALKNFGKGEDDLTFKSNSVKDITDRGREEGAARLQTALERALKAAPPKEPQAARLAALPLSAKEQMEEVEVRQEVRQLLETLQRLRAKGSSASRDASAMGAMRQLGELNVSVACLKATKIAAELNHVSWRGNEVSTEVSRYAAMLVKEWRAMYRAETGTEGTMSAVARSRKCKNLSADLEECAYGKEQKVAYYMEVVDYLCAILLGDNSVSRDVFSGTLSTKELVAKAVEDLRLRREMNKRRRITN